MARESMSQSPIEEGLLDILDAEYRLCGKNYLLLARQIEEANGKRSRFRIDRRKLAQARSTRQIGFTVTELQALETYLRHHHRPWSIARLFDQASLPEALAEKGKVVFLLGTRSFPGIGTINLSWWDVHAMAEVLRALQVASPGVDFACEDVLVHTEDMIPEEIALKDYFDKKEWNKLLIDKEDSPSLICIGSPRACHAAEIMLSTMLGIAPWVPVNAARPDVPFFYYWNHSSGEAPQLPSCVAPKKALGPANEAGIWIKGAYHSIDESGELSLAHGLIVAQRRPFGQLWVLLMGTNGPLSYGCAREMASVLLRLPRTPGQPSRVWWQAVEGRYRGKSPQPWSETGEAKPLSTDGRTLIDHHTFGDPHWWPEAEEPRPRR